MKTGDILRMAFLNLWRRKFRAFLTVLGMVIGVASIVVMVSLGIGIREATVASFAGTGSLTLIRVNSYSYVQNANGRGASRQTELNKKSVQAFRQLPGVTAVMPLVETWGSLKSGKYLSGISILGVDAETADEFDFSLSEGRLPQSRRGSYELVIGSWTFENFYDPNSYRQALDNQGNPKVNLKSRFQLTFDSSNFQTNTGYTTENTEAEAKPKGAIYDVDAVGIMSQNSNDFSYYCLMDLASLEKLMEDNKDYVGFEKGKYNQVLVKCASIDEVKAVKDAITEMGYGTYSLQDAVEMAQESTKRVQYLLGAIGGVALLVAAIGIMNTMMMSIFERTKEIGIIKVLGCRISNIAGLFLSEAAYIGLFGGALGLGLSYGISVLLNVLLQNSGLMSVIPGYLAAGAVVFSIVVALLAGFYPAVRAMKLSPLAAIRNE